ncbi:nuclear transport factor 2 family protein [Massilia sp. CF038]|uniref:nuclear transport factor 2 family protein n=1 Tax=Massilia sp. CF038 TaxID=1881045 RepID=UPI000911AF6D|nr:nuclear transport factor 2 family protein [Massilia sp. CF038]SHG71795.1 Putative lumazine-binding [Massilia sp. CF038]
MSERNAAEVERAIGHVLSTYFAGLYNGDTALLRSVFDPDAALFAVQGGARYHKPVEIYLAGVATRSSPRELGEPFAMAVLSLEVLGHMGMAKVHVPARGHHYVNYLSLLLAEGRWLIVNKLFDDVPPFSIEEN